MGLDSALTAESLFVPRKKPHSLLIRADRPFLRWLNEPVLRWLNEPATFRRRTSTSKYAAVPLFRRNDKYHSVENGEGSRRNFGLSIDFDSGAGQRRGDNGRGGC